MQKKYSVQFGNFKIQIKFKKNLTIPYKGSCNLPYGYPKRLPISLVGHMAGSYQKDKVIVCGGLQQKELNR